MAVRIEAGWDHASVGNASLRVTEDPGGTPDTITGTVGALTWCHTNISSIMGSGNYQRFGDQLETALNAATANAYTYSVTLDTSTLLYTVATSGGGQDFDIKYASGTTAEVRMFQILGLAQSNTFYSGTSTYTGCMTPYYLFSGDMGAKSKVSDDYEPDTVEDAEADDGTAYGVARTTAPIYSDYTLQFEPKVKTFKRSVSVTTSSGLTTGGVIWTYQHFIENARSEHPFLCVDDNESTVHKLRAKGAAFKPSRATADFDDHWHHEYITRMLGRL